MKKIFSIMIALVLTLSCLPLSLSGILNSFSSAIINGFTEGCNNKIKVFKRNAYGYRNFKRFRNRILHMFAYQSQKQATV